MWPHHHHRHHQQVVPFPCAWPPFSRPVGPLIAQPTLWPRYVIPCSNLLDPAYARQLNPCFPMARPPRPFESETRADGTGLITSTVPPIQPPTTPCFVPVPVKTRWGR